MTGPSLRVALLLLSSVVVGAALLLVYLVGALFIARMGHRLRCRLDHRRHPPTPTADLWRMERLPDE